MRRNKITQTHTHIKIIELHLSNRNFKEQKKYVAQQINCTSLVQKKEKKRKK